MLKRISNLLRLERIIKISQILMFSLVCSLLVFGVGFAQDVNINVQVKERKPTDTINDFQLSPTASATPQGRVLGAQSQRTKTNSWVYLLLLINPFLII